MCQQRISSIPYLVLLMMVLSAIGVFKVLAGRLDMSPKAIESYKTTYVESLNLKTKPKKKVKKIKKEKPQVKKGKESNGK